MKIAILSISCALASTLVAAEASAQTAGQNAKGTIPAAFPAKLLMGIGTSSPDDTQALLAGQKYDVQWVYLSGQSGNDWYNGFGYSPADGSWIDGFFSAIDSHGLIPGIHLYNLGYGHDTGDAGLLAEVQNATFTKAYFTEWKSLLTHAKKFGKPVLVVLEGDSFGFLEILSKNDPTTKAAVASTGLPELASLPDTLAGFGQAFLALRKAVGANNIAFGPDVPYYASGADIMNFTFDALQPHVDYQLKFFGPLGASPNATGETFDFLASNPDDADCASYGGGKPCWDPSDTAPTTGEASINRYVAWLGLFNQSSGVRWVLHQVPLGNSQHRNVPYDGSAKSGYQDNRAEFWLQYEAPASTTLRDAHLKALADAGVTAVLWGFSNDGDTAWTDIWKDGKPFLETHVAAIGGGAGLPIARGGTTSSGDAGVDAGSTGTDAGSTGSDAGSIEDSGASTSDAGSAGSDGGSPEDALASPDGSSSASDAANGGGASSSGGCAAHGKNGSSDAIPFALFAAALVSIRRRARA